MFRLLGLLLFIVLILSRHTERNEYIQFLYIGERTRPIGPVAVCIGQLIKPTDGNDYDTSFARAVLTDERTYDSLKAYIIHSPFTTTDESEVYSREEGPNSQVDFEMISKSNGWTVYVAGKNRRPFY